MADSWTALYVAYTIAWIGLFMYLVYMHFRHKRIEKDISNLKEQVAKHDK